MAWFKLLFDLFLELVDRLDKTNDKSEREAAIRKFQSDASDRIQKHDLGLDDTEPPR